MKKLVLFLLFCIVFESVITSKRSLKQRIAKAIRKLEETDDGDKFSNHQESEEAKTPPAEIYEMTPPNEPESGSATAVNAVVEASKLICVKTKTTENKTAKVQITKFHGFKVPRIKGPGKVVFGVFFYFFGRPIVKFIIIRLRITYNSRLRNLQTIAESARSDCTIADPSLMGMLSNEGINVNYNCEANATQGDASTANFTLNTDVPMTMVHADGTTEALDFQDVNFNGEAAEESLDLQKNTQQISNIYTLKETSVPVGKSILTFKGTLSQSSRRRRRIALTDGQTITMSLQDDDGSVKKYN